jgi:hypothetical protein
LLNSLVTRNFTLKVDKLDNMNSNSDPCIYNTITCIYNEISQNLLLSGLVVLRNPRICT